MLIAVYADLLEANALAMAGSGLDCNVSLEPEPGIPRWSDVLKVAETGDHRTICLRKKVPWPHRLSLLAGLRFRGLGRGKFSIPVGLGARGTCVQFTRLSDRCATGITRHG